MTDFEAIINEFSQISSVQAIAKSGSQTSGCSDEISDTDIYIYTDEEIPLEIRKCIFEKYSKDSDLDNRYWELGDEAVTKDGEALDFMYRSPDWIEAQIENIYVKNYASLGYTTCFLHNVNTSQILYDKNGWFKSLQEKIKEGYPDELSKNIINKNLPLLKEKKFASYYEQIKNALKRNDSVSVNHRLSAFLASYFDILFALNKVYHPGEKRLLHFVKTKCQKIPKDFEKDIRAVLCTDYDKLLQNLDKLIIYLYEII